MVIDKVLSFTASNILKGTSVFLKKYIFIVKYLNNTEKVKSLPLSFYFGDCY